MTMIPCPVTRWVDITSPSVLPVPHDYIGSITGFTKTPGLGQEDIMLNVGWIGGIGVGKTKIADSVTHKNVGLIQDGNDMGPLIPQLTFVPGPDNILSFLHLVTSSCKVMFSAADVHVESTPVACIMPIMPMLACGQPVSVPGAYAFTNCFNDVRVYPHVYDIAAGWATILASVFMDALTAGFDGYGKKGGAAVLDSVVSTVLGSAPMPGELLRENVPGLVGALVRAAGRRWGENYDATVSVQVGHQQGMLWSAGIQYENAPDGGQTVTAQGDVAAGLVGGHRQWSVAADGTRSDSMSGRIAGGLTHTETVTRGPDGTVSRSESTTTRGWGEQLTQSRTVEESPDGTVNETRTTTLRENTPLLGRDRRQTEWTTTTESREDGRETRTASRTRSREGRQTESLVLQRSYGPGEREL